MDRREMLTENCEDALFALLMDRVAEEEGNRLLEENERLRNDPAYAIPPDVDAHCRKTIEQAFSRRERKKVIHIGKKVFVRFAVAVLVIIMLGATAFAAFPELKIKTLNLIIETTDVATRLNLVNSDALPSPSEDTAIKAEITSDDDLLFGYQLPAVPDGFEVVDKGEDTFSGWVQYVDNSENYIYIEVLNQQTVNVDTENTSADSIVINGYEGMVIKKNNTLSIVWGDSDNGTFISIVCSYSDLDTIKAMAEEIIYIG